VATHIQLTGDRSVSKQAAEQVHSRR
jgi:hypothetical protein